VRFQRGAVDEVSFAGPALRALASLAACPEAGTWQVEEATVTAAPVPPKTAGGAAAPPSPSTPPTPPTRFLLGAARAGDPAAASLAPPVPPGTVIVGSGDAAAALTPAQAAALREVGLAEYGGLKGRALAATAALVGGGALFLLAAAGPGGGGQDGLGPLAAWAGGGAAGLAYGWALQAGVDSVGGGGGGGGGPARGGAPPALQPAPSLPARLLGSPPARIALVAGLGLAALGATTGGGGGGGSASVVGVAASATTTPAPALLRQLLTAAAGFSMYKVGLVATVAAADARGAGPTREEEEEGAGRRGPE